MGLFDFFKKKPRQPGKGIAEGLFRSPSFQQEICALALWKLEQAGGEPEEALAELTKAGLSWEQIDQVMARAKAEMKSQAGGSLAGTTFDISAELLDKIAKGELSQSETDGYFDKLFSFATLQLQNGAHRNALDLFQKCLLIRPDSEAVYTNLSILNFNMNDFEESLKNADKAIALNPANPLHYRNKAVVYDHLGLHEAEKACYEALVQLNGNDLEAVFQLSQLNVAAGEFEPALQRLNQVIDRSPDPEALFVPQLSKIGVLYELGFGQEALDLYGEMSRRFPQELSIHSIIPNLLYHKGRQAEALAFFDERLSATSNPVYLRAKADFLFSRDKQSALRCYDDYLRLRPADEEAAAYTAALLKER